MLSKRLLNYQTKKRIIYTELLVLQHQVLNSGMVKKYKMNKNRRYYTFILLLDVFVILMWIYFFAISIINSSTIWTRTFWGIMEVISIFNLYRDYRSYSESGK